MLHSQVVLPVVSQALVERGILLIRDRLGLTRPDRLSRVELFVFLYSLFHLLLLLLVSGLIIHLFNLGLLVILLNLFGLGLVDLLFDLLGHDKLNGVRDELGVLLDNLFDALLLQVFELVILHEQAQFRTTANRVATGVLSNGERATSRALPDVLLVIVVLRDDLDTLSNKVGRVETDTELTDHANVGTRAEGLHKGLRA